MLTMNVMKKRQEQQGYFLIIRIILLKWEEDIRSL